MLDDFETINQIKIPVFLLAGKKMNKEDKSTAKNGEDLSIDSMVHIDYCDDKIKTYLSLHSDFYEEFTAINRLSYNWRKGNGDSELNLYFDLEEMINEQIDSYEGIESKVKIDDKHLFDAIKNKLSKCISMIDAIEYTE